MGAWSNSNNQPSQLISVQLHPQHLLPIVIAVNQKMNPYDDPSQVIRLKKLPVGGLPLTYQQLQATNSKTNKPTATIIAINHVHDRFSNSTGHYVKNGHGHSDHYNKNYHSDVRQFNQNVNKSSINLYHEPRTFDKYNGSLGTPSVTPSTGSSPSPCSSPRPIVQTPPRSSSLVKNNSKSLSNLTHKSHHNRGGDSGNESMSSSMSTRQLNSEVSKLPTGILDEQELLQIELNFKAHKTFVYVCRCLANLYFTKTDLINGGRVSSPRSNEWELNRTGVPVLVFDAGETRSRPRRLVQLVLAERGSGFPLWKDIIDNLTDYKSIASTFHTLYISSDHRKMAGLSFDSNEAAADFLQQIELITSDPINIALTGPKGRKGRLSKSQERERKMLIKQANQRNLINSGKKKVIKSEISAPCLFQHVTSVDLSDFDKLFSVSCLMLPPPPPLCTNHEDIEQEGVNDAGYHNNGQVTQNGNNQINSSNQQKVADNNQAVNQRLSQLKISDSNSPRSQSSSSPPPSVSSSVSTIDFDSSPVPSPSLQLPIPVPPPMPPAFKPINAALIKKNGADGGRGNKTLARKPNGNVSTLNVGPRWFELRK